jgi:hypothetical protein
MGTLLPRNAPRTPGCAVVAFLLCACTTDDTTEWVAFNPDGESVSVNVSSEPSDVPTDDVETVVVPLHRSSDGAEVGEGSVTPFVVLAPDGQVTVDVMLLESVATVVGRVSVDVKPGGVDAAETYELERSARAVGAWTTELALAGGDGTSRSDTFTFRLWTAAED